MGFQQNCSITFERVMSTCVFVVIYIYIYIMYKKLFYEKLVLNSPPDCNRNTIPDYNRNAID